MVDLLYAREYAPDILKTYDYLYRQDPEKTSKYLEEVKYEVNNIKGQVESKKFLDSLGEVDNEDDMLEAIANEFGVHAEGLGDGCLIGVGKGNPDWNYSAPHGAGRIMSRTEANARVNLDEYKETISNVYTTSVNEGTLDEAPFVYKPMEEILEKITPTVEVKKILKPVYNFKASGIRKFNELEEENAKTK